MPAIPMVPQKRCEHERPRLGGTHRSQEKKKNKGTQITSTIGKNTKFAVAFAKKITERSMGTSKMLSKQPFSFS